MGEPVESNQIDASEMPATIAGNKIASPWPTSDLIIGILPLFIYVSYGLILRQLKPVYFSPSSKIHPSTLLYGAFYLVLIVYPYMTLKRRGAWPLITPIHPVGLIKEMVCSFGFMIFYGFAAGLVLKKVSVLLKINDTMAGAWEWLQNSSNEYITIPFLIFAATLGPVAEEYYFRGFLFNALKTRIPIWVAVISQALLFSIVHQYGLLSSLRIFLIGIGLALVYQYRKTLLSPILVHCAINTFWVVPAIILTLQNHHRPAENWLEAKTQPEWFARMSRDETGIDSKYNADVEVVLAINQWGSKGTKQWKKEAIAFDAILHVFPNDRHACARAKLGLSTIYLYHLHDYRRAVVEADDLLLLYPEQKEQCALALSNKGYAFFFMNDLAKAKDAFQRVLREFNAVDKAKENVRKGLDWIDGIER